MSHNMKGVSFDGVHTSSFGIYLSKVTIDTPKIKEYKIDIPGADGCLDLTDYFGGVKFENRKITFVFTFPQRNKSLLTAYSSLMNALHGRSFDRIILDDDADFHYTGRVEVGSLTKGTVSKVTVECRCRPYKYSNIRSSVTMNVTDVEYPDWLYGDVNGDGYIDNSDKVAITSLINKSSYESANALRADFDFDGVVTVAEKDALLNFLNSGGGDFKLYVQHNTSLNLRNCKRRTIDFGSSPVKVSFAVGNINSTRLWELRIDNIPQFTLSGRKSYSMFLSGVHEVMITTANTNTTGTFNISWDNAGTF